MNIKKLHKCLLLEVFSRIKSPKSVSDKCYWVNENLEKQIMVFMGLLCSRHNRCCQDYMREQENGSESFNFVQLSLNYCKAFLPYIHYPVAFDTFCSCMYTIFEFIDGGNSTNRDIMIKEGIIEIANAILKLEYYIEDKEETIKRNMECLNNIVNAHTQESVKKYFYQSEEYDKSVNKLPKYLAEYIKENFMMSLLKNKIIILLLELTSGKPELTKDAFFKFKILIDPEVFRKILAYQDYFFEKYHNRNYKVDLMYRFELSVDNVKDSCFVLEQGYILFFLLLKIRQHFEQYGSSKVYEDSIFKQIPQKERNDVSVSANIFVQIFGLFYDIFKFSTKCCRKKIEKNHQAILDISINDKKMENCFRFYSSTTSQVDILINGEIVSYCFIILPF